MDIKKQRLESEIVRAARNFSYNSTRQLNFPNSELMSDLLYSSCYALQQAVKDIEEYEGNFNRGIGYN